MISKRVFLFLLVFTCTRAQSQQDTHSRVNWKGFGFITGTNHIHHSNTKTCGVYSTPDDLESGTLSLAIDCWSEAHKIKTGFIQDQSIIKIVRDEKTYRYLKRNLYGYRDCNGNEYHFFEGKSYQLLNPGQSIGIYRIFEWKGKQRVANLFFTKDPLVIEPLTLENLRGAFADEPLFLQKLQLLAANNFQLIKNMYAINQARMNALHDEESAGGVQ
ncbi:MAG: hypothetical protein WD824_05440 [Cyclobacteriaceae bacterium]